MKVPKVSERKKQQKKRKDHKNATMSIGRMIKTQQQSQVSTRGPNGNNLKQQRSR